MASYASGIVVKIWRHRSEKKIPVIMECIFWGKMVNKMHSILISDKYPGEKKSREGAYKVSGYQAAILERGLPEKATEKLPCTLVMLF